MEDKRARKIGLIEENQEINFQSCFVAFKKRRRKKKDGIYSTAELEKQLPVVAVNIFQVNHITTN